MGLFRFSWVFMFCWGVWFLRFGVVYSQTELTVKFLKAPRLFSHLNTATFEFESVCTDCSFICKLDGGSGADCEGRKVFLRSLLDGSHTFEVCANGSRGVACASHNWTVDTVPPTAKITSSTSFTNALNVSVNISFSEPCAGGGGFACSSADSCNLLVYGPGKVKPESFTVVKANLTYSLVVELATNVIYGRVILVMDKNFCTDNAGNRFTRTVNSSFFLHFDRRSVFLDVRTHIPEKLLQLNNSTRMVLATNDNNNLKVYLYFSQPILNSSTDILNSLNASQGTLVPISGENLGNRKFGFEIVNISDISIITVGVHSISILSRPGTPVTPTAPVTFLYDSQRVAVRLSTTSSRRTTDQSVPISIKFMKPVFGFNSSFISISGGHLRSFHEISRSKYTAEIHPTNEFISVSIPQNVTWDVAGNKNLPSNVLHVRHYSVPTISSVISIFATACFVATASVAGILSVSTATLQSTGALLRPTTMLTTEPTRNLFRFACYIQVFALSRWLPVMQPVEYYELARGLRWSIPYFSLPWENRGTPAIMVGMNYSIGSHSYTSDPRALRIPKSTQRDGEGLNVNASLYGLPLTPMEYGMFFESENMKPQAEFIQDTQHSNGWRDFYRSMFWLAVISGSLILLHMFFLFILKIKKYPQKQKGYGVLTFPRFEIFLIILALPCVCESAAALVGGGMPSGVVVGALLLGVVGFVLLTLLLFLSIGITLGKLLQYKEVHQVGQTFHWYQELIRVTLGPGKKGQWTWKDQPNSVNLIMFGPLFEDLRGPPKYMLSQIYGNNPRKQGDSIIASDDETEDAEAPFIQKLFGILRIYYTLLDSLKRVTLGIVAGAYLDNWSCRTPTIILLAMTSFQLFFIVLKKPFIKKKVQLVEIISLTCQDAFFATCFVLLRKEFSDTDETKLGIFMMLLFLLGFLAHLITEWYSLYKQIRRLDPDEKSISTGLKTASIGFLMMFTPLKTTENLKKKLPLPQSQQEGLQPEAQAAAVAAAALTRNRSLGSSDKPWLKQLREMAKASFTREGNRGQSDPSTSTAKRSGFWSKKSGSPSGNSSSDFKSKPNQLYRDLEAIFSSK